MSAGPVADHVGFFPLNLESGPEFLVVYALIGVAGVLIAKGAQHIALELADPKREEREIPVSYRRAPHAPLAHERLTVGHFPRPDEIYEVAYLRDGVRGVAEAMLSRATAEGWLTGERGGRFTIEPSELAVSDDLRQLRAAIGHGSVSVTSARSIATSLAKKKEEKLREGLINAGLLRPASRLVVGSVVYAFLAFVVLSLGMLRLVRGLELHRPVVFLVLELLAIGGAFLFLAKPRKTTGDAQKYLDWLTDATQSLRTEVQEKRAHSADDVALVAALAGVALVPAFAIASAPSPIASTGFVSSCSSSSSSYDHTSGSSCSSSSSSSCSSGSSGSSCGGGGGCGGSSCGGGGGCGG